MKRKLFFCVKIFIFIFLINSLFVCFRILKSKKLEELATLASASSTTTSSTSATTNSKSNNNNSNKRNSLLTQPEEDEDIDDKVVDLTDNNNNGDSVVAGDDANNVAVEDAETKYAKFLTKQHADKSKLLIGLQNELTELESRLFELNSSNVGSDIICLILMF